MFLFWVSLGLPGSIPTSGNFFFQFLRIPSKCLVKYFFLIVLNMELAPHNYPIYGENFKKF